MKYIRTPNGEIYYEKDCVFFESDEKIFVCPQLYLEKELFEQSGILVADEKGGEITIE